MSYSRTTFVAAAVLASAAFVATPASAAPTRWVTSMTSTEIAATIHQVDGCLTKDASVWVADNEPAVIDMDNHPNYPGVEFVSVVDTCNLDASGQPTVLLSYGSSFHERFAFNRQLTRATFSGLLSGLDDLGNEVTVTTNGTWAKRARSTTTTVVDTAVTPNTRTKTTTVPVRARINVTAGAYTISGTDRDATFKQTVTATR